MARLRLILFLIGASLLWITPADGHGDADWIMAERAYRDVNGTHCCGPSDCHPLPVENAVYNRDGWTFITEAGNFFYRHDAKSLYQTADPRGGRPFICWRNINDKSLGPRCAFWAPGSS
jgi:hypothetical protein